MVAADASASACRRRASSGPGHRLVPGLAVGEAHQLHHVAEPTPLRRRSARLDVGVVRMRADDEDPQRLVRHGSMPPVLYKESFAGLIHYREPSHRLK